MSTTNIYILKLEGGRYYIGKTNNIEQRKKQHINGTASAWTKKYKPVSVEKIIPNASHFDEDKYTKEYMSKYGIDKVRGGSYVEIELADSQIETLNREIWGAKDLCKQCGRSGHFAKNCYAKSDASGNSIVYEEELSEGDSSDENEWLCDYCDRTFTTAFGCSVHEKSCSGKSTKKPYTKKGGTCYRCGNSGHYSSDCYASRHINGDYLD